MDQGQLRRSAKREELPRRCSAVGTRGDLAVVERHRSEAPPTLVLGSAPEEVWDRAGTLRAVAAQSGAGVRFAGGAPQGWEVGDIGGRRRGAALSPRRGGGALPPHLHLPA